MAQIAYRVASIDDLHNALECIASANTNIIKYTGGSNVIFCFSFASEPKVYFELMIANDVVIHQTNPVQKQSFLWARSYARIVNEGTGVISYIPKLPYKINYQCTSGQDYASSTYIGNLSGTFELRNSIILGTNDEFYIFFGEDYLTIVKYKDGQVLSYLTCSSRGEKNGDGGYILSSDSVLVRQSDNHIFNRVFSGSLLYYYNKFGVYKPNYSVDYIDTTYCSIGYNELREYRQVIPVGLGYVTVVYSLTHPWYGHCTCSLLFDSNFTNKLPNYNNLVQFLDEEGCPVMSNTLNGISLLLPNYFFIDAAPLSTHEYKYVFDTPEMCYCSMYNMLSGRIVEQNYPTKGNKFMCFSLSNSNEKNRKNNYYKGLAFMLPIRYDRIVVDKGSSSIKEI